MPITGKRKNFPAQFSIYFHVPFCLKKCPYCHFYSIFPQKDLIEKYKKAVLLHLDHFFSNPKNLKFLTNSKITSIYFGGGTPSCLEHNFFQTVLEKISNFSLKANIAFEQDLEITLEANPFQLNLKKLKAFKQAGINRLSLGVQSFENSLLKFLQRQHSREEAEKTIFSACEAGFDNLSIDLMYDIPQQTEKHFLNSVEKTLSLPITHISLYNLTFEENTVFFKKRKKLEKAVLSENLSLQAFQKAVCLLQNKNFQRYEISAFAKNNQISMHNIGYWNSRTFLGFGPSAFSYFHNKRFQNFSDLNRYCCTIEQNLSPISYEEKLDYPHNLRELLAINLRMLQGINLKEFENKHGTIDQETIKRIENLKQLNLLTEKKMVLKLTAKGALFYDLLAEEII